MNTVSTKKHWQEYWSTPNHQPLVCHEELLKNLLKVTKVKGKKILEVGAGMGGDSIFLVKQKAHVTAVDFSKEALSEIEKNAQKENVDIEIVNADAKKLPFTDETFDIVFHQGFLEHFKNPLEIILEQKRILKKGGYIVIDVPQKYTTYTIKKHIEMKLGKWFAGWEREFSIGELESLVKKTGFTIIKSYGWGYYGKLHTLRHLNLGELYEWLWKIIENSRIKLYLNWCIGVVAKKP